MIRQDQTRIMQAFMNRTFIGNGEITIGLEKAQKSALKLENELRIVNDLEEGILLAKKEENQYF